MQQFGSGSYVESNHRADATEFGQQANPMTSARGGFEVLDIKPVLAEFLPRGAIRQTRWSRELMRGYW
jgi:hypothetical protein